jgi:hypothetical protein
MLQIYWLVLVTGAFVLTLAWLLVPMAASRIHNIPIFAIGSGALWSYAALTGGSIETLTESGTRVAAPAPDLQLPALALGLLSFFAAVAYWTGHYPPVTDTVAEAERGERA